MGQDEDEDEDEDGVLPTPDLPGNGEDEFGSLIIAGLNNYKNKYAIAMSETLNLIAARELDMDNKTVTAGQISDLSSQITNPSVYANEKVKLRVWEIDESSVIDYYYGSDTVILIVVILKNETWDFTDENNIIDRGTVTARFNEGRGSGFFEPAKP